MDRCHFCHAKFPTNQTVEDFPTASSIAFDPQRGRLWAICKSCARWSLAPFESRWEALEDLERISERARVLGRSENIALLQIGDVELVRIGKAELLEEAWWRYSRAIRERKEKAKRILRNGRIKDILFTIAIGFPVWRDSAQWIQQARNKQFGDVAWYGNSQCIECGARMQQIDFADDLLLPAPGIVRARCSACLGQGMQGYFELRGTAAQQTLRRVLAYQNFAGATDRAVDNAVSLIDGAHGAEAYSASITGQHVILRRLMPVERLALEIAVNDARERDLLGLTIAALEERWKEEEDLAAIMDRELT